LSKRILLVDDAKLVLEIEKKLLRRTGCNLVTAENGVDAIRKAIDEQPDVVLLDLMLPDMTGDKVCAQLKANPKTSDIPVVMVTTKSKVDDVERCRRAGCDDYVTKPIHGEELLAKVAQLLRIPHRISKRVLVRIEAVVEAGPEPETFFGTCLDVSVGGMMIETGKTMEVGEVIAVRFKLDATTEVEARATILREERRLFYKHGYGLQFEPMPPDMTQRLKDFVESHAGGEVE